MLYVIQINVPNKTCFWLIQAPKMSNHISTNRGATFKASRKTAHNNLFILGQKCHFFSKKWWHHQKMVIALNLYICTNVLVYERWLVLKVWCTAGQPAQCFRHYIDSHCLCMWVKNDSSNLGIEFVTIKININAAFNKIFENLIHFIKNLIIQH